MAEHHGLTAADVQKLLHDPSSGARAATAAKVAKSFGAAALTMEERAIAIDILRLMMRDAEAQVRQALAENIKDNPDIPHDVARALAEDVDAVAAPLLEFSTVLNDVDLDEIVRSGAAAKQIAVAKRSGLSEAVSRTISSEAGVEAVQTLLANEKAAIPDDALGNALSRFGENNDVQSAMVHRSRLPVEVAERLVTLASDTLRDHLLSHHDLSIDVATDLLLQARERATVVISLSAEREDVPTLVARLHRHGRLTPTLILRAVCAGDFDFFECAMAMLAGMPINNAYQLIHDTKKNGLKALVDHCGLPREFHEVARVALDVSSDVQIDGGPRDRERFSKTITERVLTTFEDRFEKGSLDYLINRLARFHKTAV